MKILFVASESYPFIKVGGLGDVAYALPKALIELGIDVRVIIPKYSGIPSNYRDCMKTIDTFNVPVGWRNQYCGLQYLNYQGIPYYFIDNEYYFKRDNAYGHYDDGERFAYFSKAVLESIKHMEDFKPDIIHCNDWHTSIIPVLLKEHYKDDEMYNRIKTMLTIHNLKYQGVFPKEVLGDLLSLDDCYFREDKLRYYDAISFMKGGIVFSDLVTTVSNTYSKEIQTSFYGEGLNGLLSCRSQKLKGIVNGIDYDIYNPESDNKIFYNYSVKNKENKMKNKMKIQEKLNMPIDKNIPMIGMVTRLVEQKGLDLIADKLHKLLGFPIQLVILGTGDSRYEDLFKYYAHLYPSKLSANIFYNENLAQQIYAASDMFLMPSLFEPCGIGQLIAMRYGSIPIVRETGGLKDTVVPYNKFSGEGNGFSFKNYNSNELISTVKRALDLYNNKKIWNKLMRNAMTSNNSWENSAKNYIELYSSL